MTHTAFPSIAESVLPAALWRWHTVENLVQEICATCIKFWCKFVVQETNDKNATANNANNKKANCQKSTNKPTNHISQFWSHVCKLTHRIELYSIWCKIPVHRFLVQVDLYKFLVQDPWLCVTGIKDTNIKQRLHVLQSRNHNSSPTDASVVARLSTILVLISPSWPLKQTHYCVTDCNWDWNGWRFPFASSCFHFRLLLNDVSAVINLGDCTGLTIPGCWNWQSNLEMWRHLANTIE